METVVHTFPPLIGGGESYQALAVLIGPGDYREVMTFRGRHCFVAGVQRQRSKVGRRFYDAVCVRFLDGGYSQVIPAGEFNKGARLAALPAGTT